MNIGLDHHKNEVFTFDRNILLAVINRESGWDKIATMISYHNDGFMSIALSAANMVENQKNKEERMGNDQFDIFLNDLGLISPIILPYPLDWEMGDWENSVANEEAFQLEVEIHKIMFPQWPMDYDAEMSQDTIKKIKGRKCDVFGMWGHIYMGNDHFITNDKDFLKKKSGLIGLGAKSILTSDEAFSMLM